MGISGTLEENSSSVNSNKARPTQHQQRRAQRHWVPREGTEAQKAARTLRFHLRDVPAKRDCRVESGSAMSGMRRGGRGLTLKRKERFGWRICSASQLQCWGFHDYTSVRQFSKRANFIVCKLYINNLV